MNSALLVPQLSLLPTASDHRSMTRSRSTGSHDQESNASTGLGQEEGGTPACSRRHKPFVEGRLREAGIEPHATLELASTEAIKQAVEAGAGVGVLADAVIRRDVSGGHVRAIRIRDRAFARDVRYRVGDRPEFAQKTYAVGCAEIGYAEIIGGILRMPSWRSRKPDPKQRELVAAWDGTFHVASRGSHTDAGASRQRD